MAATVSRRGPDDRRSSVLAAPQAGRVRGETPLPAHRAGGRLPAGGPRLRPGLAALAAGMTTIVALVFLIPLGIAVQRDNRDDALAGAARRSGIVAGALAVTTDTA